MPVEIAQDEEAAEAESSPPERPWDPIIEIAVCPRGWIISSRWEVRNRHSIPRLQRAPHIRETSGGGAAELDWYSELELELDSSAVFFAARFDRKIHCDADAVHGAGRISL